MANMSYCRFRNTLPDLRDCLESIHDEITDDTEKKARHRLVKLCREIVEETKGEFD